jgi:pyruvate formate-lyase/glycerol dehydratase family glycyl radical enzyme
MVQEESIPSERIRRLKAAFNEAQPSLCVARAALYTQAQREHAGASPAVRSAQGFMAICAGLPVTIFPFELIVGCPGASRRAGSIDPELSWRWIEAELDAFESRSQDPYRVTGEQKALLRQEIFPYWRGRSLEEAYLARLPEETARVTVDTGVVDNDSKWRAYVGEHTPDFQDIIFAKGFQGLRDEAREHLAGLEPTGPESLERIEYYKAARLSCEAIIRLGERYAEAAAGLAQSEDGPRRAELETIAETCRRVPALPPRSFREAVQMVWFVQVGRILSENSVALNLGRLDQSLAPYYQADLERGAISPEAAQELMDCLWIKLSEWVWAVSSNTARFFAGYSAFQNLTIGGRRPDGGDATTAVSTMCLQAARHVRTHQPNLSVRIHADCPEPFLLEVCRLAREGMGFPAIHNDRAGTAMLMAAGVPLAAARDWSNGGCVVPHSRKVGEWTAAANINLGSALEFALNDGRQRLGGARLGLATGAPEAFTSFAEVKAAFFAQLAYLVKQASIATLVAQQVHAEMAPRPFLSLMVEGCMDQGKDLSRGGAAINVGAVLTGIGLADAANALEAVRVMVFERRSVSLAALCQALERDWDCETLRLEAAGCPKYGNDLEPVDRLAAEISDVYQREVRSRRDWFGNPFNSAFMGISNYIPAGAVVGATPDGRRAGSPLTEGCAAHAGTDITSPTALMKSAARIDHEAHSGGTLLNLKLSPDALKTDRDLANLAALIRGYFELGAFHVQFNVISPETLRAAQQHPEAHQDLLVRVAGYSARFVTLSREVQDAIIARTSYAHL